MPSSHRQPVFSLGSKRVFQSREVKHTHQWQTLQPFSFADRTTHEMKANGHQMTAVFRIADHVGSDDADRRWWTMVLSGPRQVRISWPVCRRTVVGHGLSGRQQNWRSPIVTCVLLEYSDRNIANYWSSPIVSSPWMDMVGPQPDLSPVRRVQKGLQNHRPSADCRVGLMDV